MASITWKRPDGTSVPGIAYGEAGRPGVVAIQEWWGVDFEIKAHAERISKAGYRVLVPDLYRGSLGVEAEEAQHLMDGLDWPGAVADVAGAAKFLKEEGSQKVAATGFCMGGALSLAAGINHPDLITCAAPFYGVCPDGLADPTHCKVPVLGHYGELDSMAGFSDPAAAKILEAKLKTAGCDHEILVVPGVGHAYMNATAEGIARKEKVGQGAHVQAKVDESWARLFAFFAKHLD